MPNDRNAGRKPKYPKGGEMITFQRKIPKKALPEISKAYDEMIIRNQFTERDWT